MSETEDGLDPLANIALFFNGVCSYLQLELSLLPQAFAVNRLGISEYAAGRYLSYTLDTQYLLSTAGIFIASGLTFVDLKCEKFTKVLSIPVVWLFCINYGAIWKFCSFGDFNGNMFKYCWSLILSGLWFGFCETFSMHIGAKDTSTYEMGASLVAGTMAICSIIAKACFEWNGLDIDYWMMTSQCFFSFMWSFMAALFWTAYVSCLLAKCCNKAAKPAGTNLCGTSAGATAGNTNLSTAFNDAASPFFMTQFGLAPVFLFYPLLAPMEIAPYDSCYRIEVYCKICESTVGTGIGVISQKGYIAVKWEGNCPPWNLIWLFVIPQVVCMIIINRVMHYPTSWIGRLINMKKWRATLLTATFITAGCILQYTGFAATYDNAKGENGSESDQNAKIVNVINNLSSFTVSTILMYFGEGYCSLFKDYKLAMEFGYKWPTSGVNGFRAFFFWIRVGFIKVWDNVSTVFSNRPDFQMI